MSRLRLAVIRNPRGAAAATVPGMSAVFESPLKSVSSAANSQTVGAN